MRFITDLMLGRLARWLRLLGFDTISGVVEDDEILKVAKLDSRVLLTRDKELSRSAEKLGIRSFYIGSPDLHGQILELYGSIGRNHIELDPNKSRCALCNGIIGMVGRDQVIEKIPRKVVEYHRDFWKCQCCGKIYWTGRHWENIEKEINCLNAELGQESGTNGSG